VTCHREAKLVAEHVISVILENDLPGGSGLPEADAFLESGSSGIG